MLDAQKPNAEWMNAMILKHGISARAWAEKANLGKDTVSRAIKDQCSFVTKIATLVRLADAIMEKPPGAASAIPSVETVRDILDEIFALIAPNEIPSQDVLQSLSQALRDTLLHLADEPESQSSRQATRLLARASARQLAL